MNNPDFRPDDETRRSLWDACKGKPILYALSILAVSIGAREISGLAEYTRKYHPKLAYWIFDTSIGFAAAVLVTVLIITAVGAGISIFLTWQWRKLFNKQKK